MCVRFIRSKEGILGHKTRLKKFWKIQKQPKYPSTDEWIKKLQYIHVIILLYYNNQYSYII